MEESSTFKLSVVLWRSENCFTWSQRHGNSFERKGTLEVFGSSSQKGFGKLCQNIDSEDKSAEINENDTQKLEVAYKY